MLLSGCTVGPKYHTPSAPTPAAYKELTPANFPTTDGWKVAQPKDDELRGKWWEIYNDPQLNALEEQVNISNQSIAAAAASFFSARAMVREARAQYFPTLSTNPSITQIRQSASLRTFTTGGTGGGTGSSANLSFTEYNLPFDASWQPDLFGKIRNSVRSQVYSAQASAADLENTRLTVQSELAIDYFSLRTQDALQELLDSTVIYYQESLKLTQALYETGIDSDEAVAQGARLLYGNIRQGALYSPTVLDRVDPQTRLVRQETFGPVSPVMGFRTIDDAIRIANSTVYGLSSAVCTNRLDYITRFISELNVGSVNVREVPGYRLELTPFGGIKDSGLGYKEGVQEATRSFTNIKTYSLPWLP